jgi:hypothetical protein
MKFVLSIVMVTVFAVLAAAQVAAPEVEIQAVQASVLRNDVVRFRRGVVIKVNGVAIQADEMEGTQTGREFTLRGDVRVTLPTPLTLRTPPRR